MVIIFLSIPEIRTGAHCTPVYPSRQTTYVDYILQITWHQISLVKCSLILKPQGEFIEIVLNNTFCPFKVTCHSHSEKQKKVFLGISYLSKTEIFLLFKQVFFAFMNIKPQRGYVWSILIIFDHANLKTCSIIRSRKSKNRSKIYILRTTDWNFVYNPSVWSESSHYIGCSIGVYPLKPIKGVQVEIHPTAGSQQFLNIVL